MNLWVFGPDTTAARCVQTIPHVPIDPPGKWTPGYDTKEERESGPAREGGPMIKMAAIMLFAASVVLGFGLVYSASKLAPRVGLLDRPGGRKTHAAPVPVVGGIGMFLAFAALIPFTDAPASLSIPLLCACALVVATGFLDDLKDLRPLPKFAAQVAAATLMSAGAGFALTDLGHLLGPWTLSLSVLAVPFTVLALVGVMNAVNMSDGGD